MPIWILLQITGPKYRADSYCQIINYKSCFHYNYEKNPENRLDFQCFDDVVNEPSLVESSNFQYSN